ncbi:hypothetical protein GTQ43_25060 [Nostoc sp. KVJ3]|uniref:beta strand repeat-containing protein n=1 Tax=Nostoc sp. KVJ3 TaxID=457945 RepID=UPI0022387B90|nr:calcium-binding protein [Nostoc sp. KVJ3]MCW5316966.1 hypothetical protein [Nostoc sp. KVJ3]
MPGSTLATAQNIGVLTSFNYNDAIANANPIDYYKFSLTSTNNITLLLKGVTQNYVNAFIYYDSNNNGLIESGEQLYSDYAGSGRNGQITTTLGAGNYYIGITQSSTNVNSNYSLQLSATSAPPSITSNPGNTLSAAYNIGNLTGSKSFTEFVGNVDPVDYYKFSLTGTSNITLLLNEVSQYYVNAAIYYDSNNNGLIESGEQLYSDYASNNRNGQITTTLGAGNYYVGISANTNVNSNYSLQLSATSAPPSITSNPGNTLSAAYNIGNLTGTKSFNEFVGNVDTVDYYKFSLTGISNITLLLNGVSQYYVNAAIYYDSNNNGLIESGEQLYSDYASNNRNGQITTTLGASGNYYVGISANTNVNSNYSLQLSATSVTPSIASDPGSTLSTAYNIGNLTGTKSFNEFVGNVDTVDYYKFSLTGTSNITLLLNGVSQYYVNAAIYYDSNNNGLIESGEQLYSDYASNNRNGQITTTLGASGNYYVGISANTNVNSNYSLQLSATSAPPSITSNPGNTLSTAYNIGNLTGTKSFNEFVGNIDPVDYYKFSLTGTSNITLLLNGVSQYYVNAAIYYDSNNNGLIESGEQLYSDYASNNRNGQITTTLGASGNYYVGISANTNVNSNYSLQLSATSAPPSITSNPGNTLSTAYNIGNLTGTKSFNEFVGNVDPVDYYKFSLTGTSNITLLLNGVSQYYVNAAIYYDSNNNGLIESGEQLYSDYASNNRNGQITTTLGAGNYYVGISANTNVNSNYSLQLANNTSTSNQRLTGNALNNTLIGGDGNDQLQGLAGNDTLQGGNGNDILTGGTGDDLLWGGLGDDILTGGVGKDKYLFQSSGVFNTSLGVDYITEFEAGQDQIVLSKNTFNAVTNTVGQALTDFAVVTDDKFVNANKAHIVFSQSSGSLFYNQDSNVLGTGTVFQFASLGNPDITLNSSNFSLIA